MYKKYFPDSHFDKNLNYTANNVTRLDNTETIQELAARMNIKYADIINSDSPKEVNEEVKLIVEDSDSSDDSEF